MYPANASAYEMVRQVGKGAGGSVRSPHLRRAVACAVSHPSVRAGFCGVIQSQLVPGCKHPALSMLLGLPCRDACRLLCKEESQQQL